MIDTIQDNEQEGCLDMQYPVESIVNWQPISTAPTTGRQKILLKTPYSPDGVIAYSNTWWTCGFSVECTPTHWAPVNKQ